MDLPYNLSIRLLGTYLIELKTHFHTEIYTQVFIVAASVIDSNLGAS